MRNFLTLSDVFLFPATESVPRDNGFTLAIVIMAFMAMALIYSLIAFVLGKTFSLTAWGDRLIPVIILIGIGVAGYLSYVETQSVAAVCGPVGELQRRAIQSLCHSV